MKFIISILFLFFLSTSSFANTYAILKGDIQSLSFENHNKLTKSIINVMEHFADEKQLNEIEKMLSKNDNLNINPRNLNEFISSLPLPSKTIIRVVNNNFTSPGLLNFLEYDFKREIITSYGKSVNINFEIVEIQPASNIKNTLTKVFTKNTIDNFSSTSAAASDYLLLAPISVAPLLMGSALGGSSGEDTSSTSSTLKPASHYETTEYNNHYGLAAINASEAYSRGYTGHGVTVSVMDNTFDTDHPDLVDVFVTGYNGLDASTNVHCEDNTAMNGGNNTGCSNHHGTHVAGTIAANKDDTEIHGVAYDVKVKPIVMANGAWSAAGLTTAMKINNIGEATGTDYVAMNNSWGVSTTATITIGANTFHYSLPNATNALTMGAAELAAWEAGADDTVIVFANGNHGMNTSNGRVATWPTLTDLQNETNFSGYINNVGNIDINRAGWYGSQGVVNNGLTGKWLTVVALDNTNTIATYSNGCADAQDYCICAPGSAVRSTVDTVGGDTYDTWNGTSMAAPHVTAAIAILKQQFPSLTSTQMVTLLIDSATDLGAAGVDSIYGVGMLNLAVATQPAGTAYIAAYNANVANGGSLGAPTPSNTSISFSSPFGNSFSNQNLSFGVLDSFNRSYVFDANVNYSNNSVLHFENLVDSMENKTKNKIFDSNNTTISYTDSEISNNSIQDIQIDHKIKKFNLNFTNQSTKNNVFNNSSNSHHPRFNKIQSTDKKIINFSTNYNLNNKISLTSGFVRGRFNNLNEFKETSFDINYDNNFYSINYGYGIIVENNQFLGTETTGAYRIDNPSVTNFFDISNNLLFNDNLEMYSNYSKFTTVTDMAYKNFVNISNIESDEFKVGITYSKLFMPNDKLDLNYILPLSTTNGNLTQFTTKGYKSDGSYNSVTENYSLVNENREQNVNLVYKYNLKSDLNFVSSINFNKNYQGQENNNILGLYQGLSFSF